MAVSWRKNEDDAKMDGDRLQGEVVMMDEDYKEKLELEEHVSVLKRVFITREDLGVLFGFSARCPGCTSFAERDGETSAHRKLPKVTAKAEAAQRRVKENHERAAKTRKKRSRARRKDRRINEFEQQ